MDGATGAQMGRRTTTDHVRVRPYVSALLRLLELNSPQLRDDSDPPMPELSVSTRALLAQRRVADLEAQARAQQARVSHTYLFHLLALPLSLSLAAVLPHHCPLSLSLPLSTCTSLL
eukprot:TRINITY_DN1229_c0_g2_i1.p1 TRINITY_DN1229_c0_g2~~TRINITY_DN1229_c0_g2_i1.p1  ORF type:complete len:117 (+),score=3.29 TRINITY_DN1229_c0_g2_i1:250-600(+)